MEHWKNVDVLLVSEDRSLIDTIRQRQKNWIWSYTTWGVAAKNCTREKNSREKDKGKTKNDAAGLDDGWRKEDELQRIEGEIIKPSKLASMESKTCLRAEHLMMMHLMN